MHPRKFIRDSVSYAIGQYLYRAALMLRGVIAMRILGPQSYGLWNALQLVMDYGTMSPAGTLQGLDQTLPPRLVEADASRIDRLQRAGLFNVLTLTLIFCACVLTYYANVKGRLVDFWGWPGIVCALLSVLLTTVGFYHLNLLRARGMIQSVSSWYVLQGLIGAALGIAILPFYGPWGLLWAWLAATFVALVVVRVQSRGFAPLLPRVSVDSKMLLEVGLPMFLFTGASFVMRNLDRIIILHMLGTLDLGYYGLSVMALTLLAYLPDSISYVLYPEILRRFRESGNDPASIRDRVDRAQRAIAVMVPALCGVGFLIAREFVLDFLPKYLPGVAPVRILCFGAAALATTSLSSIVVTTLGRQRVLIPAAILMATMSGIFDFLAVKAGLGIRGVAWATLLAYAVNGVTLLWIADSFLGLTPRQRLRGVARVFAPLIASGVIAFLLDRFVPWGNSLDRGMRLVHLALTLVGFVGLYLLCAYPVVRGMGLRTTLMEFNLPFLRTFRRGNNGADR